MSHVHEYFEYKLEDIKKNGVIDIHFYQRKLKDAQNIIDKYANEYDIALHSLTVLEVAYPKDKILNFITLDGFYDSYLQKLNECKDTESLIKLFWENVLPEMQDSRKKTIASLTIVRQQL